MEYVTNKVASKALKSFYNKVAKEETEREVRIEIKELPQQVKDEAEELNILQAKMEEFPGGYTRIRKETPGGCTFTRKSFDDSIEDNIEISEDLFNKLMKTSVPYSKQDKKRLIWKGWDIDTLEDGTVLAEYELPNGEDTVEVPEVFEIVKVKEQTSVLK